MVSRRAVEDVERAAARRGHISAWVEAIPRSGIREFFELLSGMDGVISLGVGEPDFATPVHISEAAVRSIDEGRTGYTSNYGLMALREAVATHLERLYGVSYDPADEVLITTGSSEALDIAVRSVVDPGDEVLGADPYYVAYLPCVVLAGGVFVPVRTTAEQSFKLSAEDLEARITPRSKAIVIGYPSNPTGAVMDRDGLLAIAEVAERHNLFVISDEVYDRLVYDHEHVCFASLPGMRDRTVIIGGVSKAYAMTGWRLGWVTAPPELLSAMMKVHQYIMMSAPTPAQYAALEALAHGEEDVRGMVAEYDRRRRVMVAGLNALGLTCFEPRGAFFTFPQVTEATGLSDEEFAKGLLRDKKVAVVPGSAFGEGGRGHVRACYATSMENIERALELIGEFLREGTA